MKIGKALNEIDLAIELIETNIKKLELDKNEDPDYIGTMIATGKRNIKTLDFLRQMVQEWPEDAHCNDILLYDFLNVLIHGEPLTAIHSYDENPDEWTDGEHVRHSKRWPELSYSFDGSKWNYSDISRFKLFDMARNKNLNYGTLASKTSPRIANVIFNELNKIIPVEFPYYVSVDRYKIYMEIFETDKETTIALLYSIHISDVRDRKKICKFYDISDKIEEGDPQDKTILSEITTQEYMRRKDDWYKYMNEKEVNEDEENTNDDC